MEKQIFNIPVVLNELGDGTADLNVLTVDANGEINEVLKSSIGGGSTPDINQVLVAGNTVDPDKTLLFGIDDASMQLDGNGIDNQNERGESTLNGSKFSVTNYSPDGRIDVTGNAILIGKNNTFGAAKKLVEGTNTHNDQEFALPDKSSGTHIIATIDDIPSLTDFVKHTDNTPLSGVEFNDGTDVTVKITPGDGDESGSIQIFNNANSSETHPHYTFSTNGINFTDDNGSSQLQFAGDFVVSDGNFRAKSLQISNVNAPDSWQILDNDDLQIVSPSGNNPFTILSTGDFAVHNPSLDGTMTFQTGNLDDNYHRDIVPLNGRELLQVNGVMADNEGNAIVSFQSVLTASGSPNYFFLDGSLTGSTVNSGFSYGSISITDSVTNNSTDINETRIRSLDGATNKYVELDAPDGIHLGTVGGFRVGVTSETLTSNKTLTLPDETGILATQNYVATAGGTVNTTTVALSSATLNSTYPNVPVLYEVVCPNITLGAIRYQKVTEAGGSDVWMMNAITLVT